MVSGGAVLGVVVASEMVDDVFWVDDLAVHQPFDEFGGEHRLIRFRAGSLWVLLSGLAVGVIWAVFQGDRPDAYVYTVPDRIFRAGLGSGRRSPAA